jgi:hypothetical protein
MRAKLGILPSEEVTRGVPLRTERKNEKSPEIDKQRKRQQVNRNNHGNKRKPMVLIAINLVVVRVSDT